VSWWYNICCTVLETFGERLILDNVVELDAVVLLTSPNHPVDDKDMDR
jgi:hypothetical protein